ncbi:MAG: MFS transporter [Desulfobacteraceae bacterium]|nr:MFS transporter [Desulfobacteraceae bacterium]
MDNNALKKSALIIAALNSFITPFMGSSINIALPAIEKDFHVDAVLLSWIATAYLLAVAVSLVPFGRLADIYGRKKVFTSGVLLFTISSFLCAVSFSTPMLIVFRIFQGVGNAMVFATGMAILVSVYPPQERGKVLGINVAAVYIGLSAGPFLGGILTQYFTWRSIFLVTIPICLFILILIFWRLKGEWADAKGEKFDLFGAFIYAVAIVGILYGLTLLPSFRSLWVILIGILGLFVFIKWELKEKSPVFQVRLFKTNRVFAFSSLAALINYSATFALTFLLSLYLQHIKALSPQLAGLVLVAQPVVMAMLSPSAGKLSDRIEPGIVATLGMALTTVGLFLLTFLEMDTSLVYIVGCLVLLGFGFALFSSPNTNAILSSVEKRFFGLASGTVGTMRALGMMVSMGIATVVFSIFIGRIHITPEHYPVLIKSIKVAFVIFAIFCFGGIFASLVRGKLRGGQPQPTQAGSRPGS